VADRMLARALCDSRMHGLSLPTVLWREVANSAAHSCPQLAVSGRGGRVGRTRVAAPTVASRLPVVALDSSEARMPKPRRLMYLAVARSSSVNELLPSMSGRQAARVAARRARAAPRLQTTARTACPAGGGAGASTAPRQARWPADGRWQAPAPVHSPVLAICGSFGECAY